MIKNLIIITLLLLQTTVSYGQDGGTGSGSPTAEQWLNMLQNSSPEEVQKLRKLLDGLLKAASKRANGPVNGSSETVALKFRGGQASQTIDLVTERLSVVGVYDRFMQPIIIEDIQFSDREGFEINAREESNNLTIMPIKDYANGNVVVFLKGENEPLVLDLKTQSNKYLSKINLQLDIVAAGTPYIQSASLPTPLSDKATDKYFAFIDGRPPEGTKQLTVSNTNFAEAWTYKDELIVLSHADIYSPPARAIFHTPDNLKLYVFPKVNELVVLDSNAGLVMSEISYE